MVSMSVTSSDSFFLPDPGPWAAEPRTGDGVCAAAAAGRSHSATRPPLVGDAAPYEAAPYDAAGLAAGDGGAGCCGI